MYESQHGSPMNNYSDINPYIMIYYNMNIRIHQDINREAAENVVKQIGYMHNAIGHVFKDLAKILSYKFPEINATNNHQYRKEIVINKNDYSKSMEIQEMNAEPRLNNKLGNNIQKERATFEKSVQESKRLDILEKRSVEELQQAQKADLFGEFAYGREEERKKNEKGLDYKSSIAKMVEQKVSKKKKQGKNPQHNDKKKPSSTKQKEESMDRLKTKPEAVQRQFIYSQHNQLKNILNNHSIEDIQPQENDIFSEFQYENVGQMPKEDKQREGNDIEGLRLKSIQEVMEKEEQRPQGIIPQEQGSYWNYYKQKPEPNIYEISDDDD